MTMRTLWRLLNQLLTDDSDYEPCPRIWISDDLNSFLVELSTGRTLAEIDQVRGGYSALLFVSAWRALRLMNDNPEYEASWDAFPRVALYIPNLKAASGAAAQRKAIELLT